MLISSQQQFFIVSEQLLVGVHICVVKFVFGTIWRLTLEKIETKKNIGATGVANVLRKKNLQGSQSISNGLQEGVVSATATSWLQNFLIVKKRSQLQAQKKTILVITSRRKKSKKKTDAATISKRFNFPQKRPDVIRTNDMLEKFQLYVMSV